MYKSKYLPVEGELIDSLVYATDTNLVFNMSYADYKGAQVANSLHLYKPVKLFLISDDIQVGDIIYHEDYHAYPNGTTLNTNSDVIDAHHMDGDSHTNAFKVIGEIITPGIEEGREFKRNDFECLWRLGLNMGVSLNEVDDGSIDEKAEIVVKIK